MFSWGHNLAQSYQDYPTLNAKARPGCYLCFWPTSYQLKVPQTPMINLLQCLTELRKTVYLIRLLIYYKGQEWTVKEIHRVRSEKVLNTGASVLWSLRCVTLSAWWCILVNQSGSSTKSEVQEYLWRLHYMGLTNWIFGHWGLNSISSHHPWPHMTFPGGRLVLSVPTL